jgi:hypothetical protein
LVVEVESAVFALDSDEALPSDAVLLSADLLSDDEALDSDVPLVDPALLASDDDFFG